MSSALVVNETLTSANAAANCSESLMFDFKNDTALMEALAADVEALMCQWSKAQNQTVLDITKASQALIGNFTNGTVDFVLNKTLATFECAGAPELKVTSVGAAQ